jgi:DNA-binding response OmpR family regulator
MGGQSKILIVDADAESAQRMAVSFDNGGFGVAWSSFSPSEIAEFLKDFKPHLLLVHAELASPQVTTLLARLDGAGASKIPLVMLCKDVTEGQFVPQLKSGIVEMLAEPFHAKTYLQRLRQLLDEIELRKGEIRGLAGAQELGRVVHHIMRTRRSGALMVDGASSRAFFVRGVLKSAQAGDLTQQAALAAMTRINKPWLFVEGADANSVHADISPEADEPKFQLQLSPPTPQPVFESASKPSVAARQPAAYTEPNLALPVQTSGAVGRNQHAEPKTHQPTLAWNNPPPPVASTYAVADAEAAQTPLLFVDDEPSVVQMLHNYFSKKGYPCATAADGLEALVKLSQAPYEMVIADLNMPRLDGWGLLKLIREDFRTHEVPVALFSAHDSYRENLRLTQSGAQAYFTKTAKLSALEIQLKELLEPRRRFVRLIGTDGGIHFNFSQLGIQWVLRALSKNQFSGQLDARDPWAAWRLWFVAGRLVQVSARVQRTEIANDRALCAFLASKQCEGSLTRDGDLGTEGFAQNSTEDTLKRLVPWMNEEQGKLRESELVKAKALRINDELYGLYLTVTPPQWTDMVRMLCESRSTPAEVIAHLRVAPQEVATVVRDLLRRGVATLQ